MTYKYAGYWLDSLIDQNNHALVSPSTVAVYVPGTTTLIPLYTDQTKAVSSPNPFTIPASGDVAIWADPGFYEILPTLEAQPLSRIAIMVPLNPAEVSAAPDQIATFQMQGTVITKTGAGLFLFPYAGQLVSVTAVVNSAPTGAAINLDVILNGASIWPTNPGNKPSIASGQTISGVAIPDTTAFIINSTMSVNVLQAGSSVPGSDLTVAVRYN